MQICLTDTAIASRMRGAKTTKGRVEITDTTAKGLRCRITGEGAKWCYVGKDDHGKVKKVTLGAYPAMGISAAREAARAMREKVRAGEDPTAEKRRKKALGAAGEVSTLQALLDAFTTSSRASQSWHKDKSLVHHVFAGLLTTKLEKLRLSDIHIMMEKHPAQSSAALAGRNLRVCMKWAKKMGYVDRELTFIEPPSPPASRERVLSDEELKALILELDANQSVYAPPMRFLIWTLSRLNETCKTKWSDFNLETGEWYVKKTKTDKPLVLKLPRQAVAFLKARKNEKFKQDDLVFPNSKDTNQPLSNWDRATKQINTSGGWHRHDLRRTGATKMGGLGIDERIVDAALNHKNLYSRSLAPYMQYRPDSQVSEALQKYADWLDDLIAVKKE
jgi:integrase